MFRCYFSPETDPYFNLSLEERLLRNETEEPVILFYSNRPAVVIGRNQNPWAETDGDFLREHGIALVRRCSGGGAVYHDAGNLNFCILTNKKDCDKARNMRTAARALSRFFRGIEVSPRNDLLISDKTGTSFKISGSACRMGTRRAYHHGTLLISAALPFLRKALSPRISSFTELGGTPSVRSSVKNLNDFLGTSSLKPFSPALFQESLVRELTGQSLKIQTLAPEQFRQQKEFRRLSEELTRPAWIYGKTPAFRQRLVLEEKDGGREQTLSWMVRDGRLEEVAGPERFRRVLEQAPYASRELRDRIQCGDFSEELKAVLQKETACRSPVF